MEHLIGIIGVGVNVFRNIGCADKGAARLPIALAGVEHRGILRIADVVQLFDRLILKHLIRSDPDLAEAAAAESHVVPAVNHDVQLVAAAAVNFHLAAGMDVNSAIHSGITVLIFCAADSQCAVNIHVAVDRKQTRQHAAVFHDDDGANAAGLPLRPALINVTLPLTLNLRL